jgi:hypothetical protein
VIWVYGICERPELPPPRRRGLAQAPLDGVREGDLLAVISRHVHAPGEPALDALWVHERVVERLMADRAVLPMRFGSKLPDDESLREALVANQESFVAALDRVRGRVELGVRAMATAAATPAADELLRASYLVERTAVPQFRSVVERLQRIHPEVAILCTGPWPPYSFVDSGEVRATEPVA